MTDEMGTISRIPAELSDTPDGVEMMAKCNVTNFKIKNKQVTGMGSQYLANCKLLASFDNGVLSVSVRTERPFIVSVRLDEVMALLKEAADYHKEVATDEGEKEEAKDE